MSSSTTPTPTFMGFPLRVSPLIPEGHVMIHGYRESGPGTLDRMEEYGVVLRPDGSIVEFVRRDGKLHLR